MRGGKHMGLPSKTINLPPEFSRAQVSQRLQREIKRRMKQTVESLVEESRRIVKAGPYRTGNLYRSLKSGVSESGLEGYYGSNKGWLGEEPVFYWDYVEYGVGRGPEQPYLRPPLQTMQSKIDAIWKELPPPAEQHVARRVDPMGFPGGRAGAYRAGAIWGDIRAAAGGPTAIFRRVARKAAFKQFAMGMRQVMPTMPHMTTGVSIQQYMPHPAIFALAGRAGLYSGGKAMGDLVALGRGPMGIAQRQFRRKTFSTGGRLISKVF